MVRKVIESFRHVFSLVHLPSEEFSEKNDLLLLKYSLCIFLEIISTPHSLHKIKMAVTNAFVECLIRKILHSNSSNFRQVGKKIVLYYKMFSR